MGKHRVNQGHIHISGRGSRRSSCCLGEKVRGKRRSRSGGYCYHVMGNKGRRRRQRKNQAARHHAAAAEKVRKPEGGEFNKDLKPTRGRGYLLLKSTQKTGKDV